MALAILLVAGCAAEEDGSRYKPGPTTGPLPTHTPIVAAAGGIACIGQSTLCVTIPAGALSEDATVSIARASGFPSPAAVLAASAFEVRFVPDTVVFSGIATLTYQLSSVALAGRNLGVVWVAAGAWSSEGITSLAHITGTALDVVSADTDHFTIFAVVDVDALESCACDADSTCTDACDCDPDCCFCDTDATCSAACACDADCCPCDTDSTCTDGCDCDPDCCLCDADSTCTGGCDCDPDCGTAPVAIADVVACPANPCTDPATIQPFDRVYLDGRGSYDPDDALNPAAITTWSWQIVGTPNGVTPTDMAPSAGDSSTFDFSVPAVGIYEVQLEVWDVDGLKSVVTQDARVALVVMATGQDVQVVLTWDTDTDQDLHLTYTNQADLMCNVPYDCFYDNRTPVWFVGDAAGSGANPTMDNDSASVGPETISIDTTDDGTFRIYVHYYDSSGASTVATVSVMVLGNGYTFERSLAAGEVWAVADIVVAGGGLVGVAQEYPTDGDGTGAVATMAGSCEHPGWDFP